MSCDSSSSLLGVGSFGESFPDFRSSPESTLYQRIVARSFVVFSSEYLLICGVQQDFRFLVVAPPRSIIPALFFPQFMYPGANFNTGQSTGSVSSQYSTFDIFVLGAISSSVHSMMIIVFYFCRVSDNVSVKNIIFTQLRKRR